MVQGWALYFSTCHSKDRDIQVGYLSHYFMNTFNVFYSHLSLAVHTSGRDDTVFLVLICFSRKPIFAFIILSRCVGWYGALPDLALFSFRRTAPNIDLRVAILSRITSTVNKDRNTSAPLSYVTDCHYVVTPFLSLHFAHCFFFLTIPMGLCRPTSSKHIAHFIVALYIPALFNY